MSYGTWRIDSPSSQRSPPLQQHLQHSQLQQHQQYWSEDQLWPASQQQYYWPASPSVEPQFGLGRGAPKATITPSRVIQSIESVTPAPCPNEPPGQNPYAVGEDGETGEGGAKSKRKRAPRVFLGDQEKLALVKMCLANAETYGIPKKIVKWWDDRAMEFHKWSQKPYTKVQDKLTKMVSDRRAFLATLGTGEEDEPGPFSQAVDAWIKVIEEVDERNRNKQKTAEELKADNERSITRRDNLAKTLSTRKRLRGGEDDTTDDEGSSESDDDVQAVDRPPAESSPPVGSSPLADASSTRDSVASESRASSRASSRAVDRQSTGRRSKMTRGKRARLQAAQKDNSVIGLTDALKDYLIDRRASNSSAPDVALSKRIGRLEEKLDKELKESKEARASDAAKLDTILSAINNLTK